MHAIMQLTKFTYTAMLSYTFAFLVSKPYMMTHIFVRMSTLVEASKQLQASCRCIRQHSSAVYMETVVVACIVQVPSAMNV